MSTTALDTVEVLPGPDHPRFDGEFQVAIAKEAGVTASEAKPVIQQAPRIPTTIEEKPEETQEQDLKEAEKTLASPSEDLWVGLASEVVAPLTGGDKKLVRTTESAGPLAVKLEREQKMQPDKVVTMEEDK